MAQRSRFNEETAIVPKPFLRWSGSKTRLLHKLTPYWPKVGARYVEPFAGSAALFYALRPNAAVLSDSNGELIRTMNTVCQHPGRVYSALKELPRGSESYYKIRKLNPTRLGRINRAARFIFLNRFCFNGLYRTN